MLGSVDSTNSEAARIQRNLEAPTWIVAGMQTAGRGRRNRFWHSHSGNLFATLAMRARGSPGNVALRSFVAALALRDASKALAPGADIFSIKWPNDLLAGNRKFAGILLECDSGENVGCFVRIGFGVNIASAPGLEPSEADAFKATSFFDATGIYARPEDYLSELAAAYAERESQFQKAGFESIRKDWLMHAARLGETVRVNLPTESFSGVFESIDDAGRAVIDAARGRRLVAAADIFF
ncbi:MAG: biotin--[acetyl-CoA-carboxylase] ligase [Albidovulum sp.]|nr:biotin--[acetyl-CoA-carboxylase] ligase [Albidovulum sp.]MDE0531343.1 biotin--[acetyl-CoA-carboxylase] ligase [Albidovulum sp.]